MRKTRLKPKLFCQDHHKEAPGGALVEGLHTIISPAHHTPRNTRTTRVIVRTWVDLGTWSRTHPGRRVTFKNPVE